MPRGAVTMVGRTSRLWGRAPGNNRHDREIDNHKENCYKIRALFMGILQHRQSYVTPSLGQTPIMCTMGTPALERSAPVF